MEVQLEQLFSDAREEQFEVGVDSQFSKGLQQLYKYNSVAVMRSLKTRLNNGNADSELSAEVLRWASRLESDEIRNSVVDLLSIGLQSASSLVRDTAALSLASLEEASAISQLQRALEREKVPELREDLQDLIESLEY